MTLVKLSGVDIRHDGRRALHDVSLSIARGEIVTVVGPNGSGKTTLMRANLGALRPSAGRLLRAPGLEIGYVPRRLAIDPGLPLGLARFLSLPHRRSMAETERALRDAGLAGTSDRPLWELFGGQLQRVMLARALMDAPDLLILDEPTTGLDQPGAANFYRQLARLRDARGCAVLMVGHDLHVVMPASDRVIWDGFVLRAVLAELGVVLAAAPLGCFTIWRRMACFGDATAHGALLGVALALSLGAPILPGMLAVSLALALLMMCLTRAGASADTALGVLSHAALALGLVVSFQLGPGIGLEALNFRDILSVSAGDVALIWSGALTVAALMAWRWQALLTATLDADLARAAGIEPERERLALTVAIAEKVVGALLIAAMLILPAAAARPLATRPERMVALAALLGALSVLDGMALSLAADTPAGPSMISAAAALFAITSLGRGFR